MLRAWNWMIRGKYGVKIAENVVWKRSDESWKNVVGFPPAAIISLAIADCEAESIAGNQRTATRSRPPLMYTYMLQTPLLCAPPLIIYILPTSKMYGRMVRGRRPNGRQLFWIPRPARLPPGNGLHVIGLFANRAQHGIVLMETFSVSQRVSTPFEGSLSCSPEYICTKWLGEFLAVYLHF